MNSFSNNINKPEGKDFIVKLEGKSDYLSQNGGGIKPEDASAFKEKLTTALSNLSELENSEKLREDAISNGKAIIKNWHPPTNDQIDKILTNMEKDLLK